jgi:hypothetical protein
MALVLANRVKETTTTTGTGTVTLLGASTGYQSFAVIGNANTTYYTIAGQTGSEWEVGIGTYTSSGTTLARTTVLASSNSGSLVNFSAGTKDVFVTQPSEVTTVSSNNPGTSGFVLTSNGSGVAPSWTSLAAGASLSNDTSTSTNLYPMFAAATSGTPTTVYTSNAKLLYKPSTGELQATALVASNGIMVNSQTVASDYTIASGNNGMSAGTVSVASGITVTIASGSTWVVV